MSGTTMATVGDSQPEQEDQMQPSVTCFGPSPYRSCMLDVRERLSQLDVQHMLYAASEFLPKTEREETPDAVRLFLSLEKAGVLGEGNVAFLIDLLKVVHREDVAEMVANEAGNDGCARQLSSYKRCMAGVAVALVEDFQPLMYAAYDQLPEDRRETVKSSVDVLRAIESKWESKEECVKFLLNCLIAMRRWDMIFHIARELSLDAPAPALPPCSKHFGCATMLLLSKKDQIGRLSEKLKQLRNPTMYHPRWKKRFDPFFDRLVKSFSHKPQKLPEGDRNIKTICDTLSEMSSCGMRWAGVLIHLYENPSAQAIGAEIKQCHEQFVRFQDMLPHKWMTKQQAQVNDEWGGEPYPLRIAAHEASGYLKKIAKGVFREADSYDHDFLSNDLCLFESLTFMFGRLLVFAAWTSTVLDFALSCKPALSKGEEKMLCTLLQTHWHSFDRNRATLEETLGPDLVQNLECLIMPNEYAGIQESVNDAPLTYPAPDIHLPLESVLLLTAVVVLKSSRVPVSSEVLRLKLSEYIKAQKAGIEDIRFGMIDIMHEAICDAVDRAKAASIQSFLDRLYPAAEYRKYQRELKQLFHIVLF